MPLATTQVEEVAHDLVNLCKDGRWSEAIDKHYAENVVSLEPAGDNKESVGLAAVKAKAQWWFENFEIHDCKIEGPFVGGNKFVVRFTIDVTFKPDSKRSTMDELALYTVADGKIVHEQFFYDAE